MAAERGGQTSTLYLVRMLEVPREQVFPYLLSPSDIKRWWRPAVDFEVVSIELQAQVGGLFRIGMRPRGSALLCYASGRYRDIHPPAWLVHTWKWETTQTWSPETRETLPPESVLGWQLKSHREGRATELFFWQNGLLDEHEVVQHRWAWSEILDNLSRYVVT